MWKNWSVRYNYILQIPPSCLFQAEDVFLRHHELHLVNGCWVTQHEPSAKNNKQPKEKIKKNKIVWTLLRWQLSFLSSPFLSLQLNNQFVTHIVQSNVHVAYDGAIDYILDSIDIFNKSRSILAYTLWHRIQLRPIVNLPDVFLSISNQHIISSVSIIRIFADQKQSIQSDLEEHHHFGPCPSISMCGHDRSMSFINEAICFANDGFEKLWKRSSE